MGFMIPEGFSDDVNGLGDLLDRIDAAIDEDKENELIREALSKACRLLNELDRQQFVIAASSAASLSSQRLFDRLLADPFSFSSFIAVEDKILALAGINEPTRGKIIGRLREAREYLRDSERRVPDHSPSDYDDRLTRLARGICQLKDDKIDYDRRQEAKGKLGKVIGKTAVIVNAAGPFVAPYFPDLLPQGNEVYSASVVFGEVAAEL